MKKLFLSLMLLATFTGALFAQNSLVATLNHNGEISVFYGGEALKDAHAAAQHGDAITLSSGTFKAVDITKAITLRGAGMEVDSVRNTLPTIIQGDMTIAIGDSVNEKLTIEGIFHHNSTLNIKNVLNNATFLKNRFYIVKYNESSTNFIEYNNNRFIQCKISNYISAVVYNSSKKNLHFTNCFINNINNINTSVYVSYIFTNCIIMSTNNMHINYLHNCTFHNCILISLENNAYIYHILPSSSIAYNCISLCEHSMFQNIPNTTNRSAGTNYATIFKTYKGTYTDTETFELIDSIKTKYLGNDGTQVGIYGGMLPYSPTPTNPQITKCKVASRSTADGKLSVDIEVKSAE